MIHNTSSSTLEFVVSSSLEPTSPTQLYFSLSNTVLKLFHSLHVEPGSNVRVYIHFAPVMSGASARNLQSVRSRVQSALLRDQERPTAENEKKSATDDLALLSKDGGGEVGTSSSSSSSSSVRRFLPVRLKIEDIIELDTSASKHSSSESSTPININDNVDNNNAAGARSMSPGMELTSLTVNSSAESERKTTGGDSFHRECDFYDWISCSIAVSCQLIRDVRVTIAFKAKCHAPQMVLSATDLSFAMTESDITGVTSPSPSPPCRPTADEKWDKFVYAHNQFLDDLVCTVRNDTRYFSVFFADGEGGESGGVADALVDGSADNSSRGIAIPDTSSRSIVIRAVMFVLALRSLSLSIGLEQSE